ncbi:hypothetical protein [Pseudofrankia inefficax]|uniref:hypothetical protein n=1 Tax=Pseudofrankia inefficax (strain DSM 45817 / CECT 9037 / DDB 130130 / EuI1c) TaxID=298654 RepID=UPI0012FE4FC1|nr:hypothetical protein [Pseudofrankia inefficax]
MPPMIIAASNDTLATLNSVASFASQIVQVLAISVGGFWGYFKFIRGRTFSSRTRVSIDGSVIETAGGYAVRAVVELNNVGLVRLPLGMRIVTLSVASRPAVDGANLQWRQVLLTQTLTGHDWLEGQEVVKEEELLPIPNHCLDSVRDSGAVKLRSEIWSKKGFRWTATTVIDVSSVIA